MNESEGKKKPTPTKEGGKSEKGLSPSAINKEELKAYPVHLDDAFKSDTKELQEFRSAQEAGINRAFDKSPIDSLDTPQKIAAFAETLVNANMCPYKSAEDATIALIAGKELGLSLAATLGGIHPIEGKPSLGIHIKKGILLQNNVIFRKIRDFEDWYEFVDLNPTEAKKDKYKPSILGYGYLDDLPKYQKVAQFELKKRKIDVKTEYLFTRYFKTAKGVIKNTAIGMFSVGMATQAELHERGTYVKYARDMIANRAFGRGASEIADDLLHGMYNYSDLADISNSGVTYYIDENGHEHIVN